MGNSCPRPNVSKKGFLDSVSAVVWRAQPTEEGHPSKEERNAGGNGDAAQAARASKPPDNPMPVQNNPPEPVKIVAEEKEPPAKAKKPHQIKRVESAGLQVDSVLQRKTGSLKDVYTLGRKLGQGQFGTTYFCVDKVTGKECACKSIAKRKLVMQEDVEDVRKEIQIMHHLAGHPNVISILGAYEDAVAVHVVMELCAGGELFDRIIQRGHYTEKKAAELARVIVSVVEACHSLGVMHRDLKPENFLFVNQKEEALLKTIDFGLSTFFKPGKSSMILASDYEVIFCLLHFFISKFSS